MATCLVASKKQAFREPETLTLPPRDLYRAIYVKKVVPTLRVKIDCEISYNLYWIKMLSFLQPVNHCISRAPRHTSRGFLWIWLPKCWSKKMLSRLSGLTYLPRRNNLHSRVFSASETTRLHVLVIYFPFLCLRFELFFRDRTAWVRVGPLPLVGLGGGGGGNFP